MLDKYQINILQVSDNFKTQKKYQGWKWTLYNAKWLNPKCVYRSFFACFFKQKEGSVTGREYRFKTEFFLRWQNYSIFTCWWECYNWKGEIDHLGKKRENLWEDVLEHRRGMMSSGTKTFINSSSTVMGEKGRCRSVRISISSFSSTLSKSVLTMFSFSIVIVEGTLVLKHLKRFLGERAWKI